jgi:tetratricopeptide (TPR) repeat protein
MIDDAAVFGARLCACRQSAGMSQQELAERSGLSIRALSNMERGRTRWPHPDSVRRLADALDLHGDAREEFFATAGRRLAQEVIVSASTEPKGGPVQAGSGQVVPRQLPGLVRQFVGRKNELDALTGLLDEARTTPAAVVISAIGGTAGVGKTALAIRWAHQVAGNFPDGQLYVDLRGYDPGQPMTATDALAAFLRCLDVPGQAIPAEVSERAARFRSLLAGRRMLVILDNAGQSEQVRPLLPGSPGCVTLVTSRDALAGLVARDGAVRLDLDLLPLTEAVALLRALIGGRVDAEPEAAAALAALCARLPLALRVAAELATARPAANLAGLAEELAGQQQRLDSLDASGDPHAGIRAVFSWSCQHLDTEAAGLFRLLGLHPGLDLDLHAAAALADSTVDHSGRVLDVLTRAHLIQPTRPGRHVMHDLLRAYARELACAEASEEQWREALTRLFDYYLYAAATAMDTLFPAERHRRPRIPPPATAVPPLAGAAEARAWLDAESANLIAVAAHTADHGWPGHAIMLSATLFRHFDTGGYFPEAIALHGHALRAARRTGDRSAEGAALTSLGLVDGHQGRHQQAIGHFEQALARYRETGDLAGQARALNYLGLIDWQRGRYRPAAGKLQRALSLFRGAGERTGEAYALSNIGLIEGRRGRDQLAIGHQQQALTLLREAGDRHGEATVLGRLGLLGLRQGRYQQAAAELQRALGLFREFGDRQGEATVLGRLGLLDLRQGRYQQAAAELRQALDEYREIADPGGQAEALNSLGEVLLARGVSPTLAPSTPLRSAWPAKSAPRQNARAPMTAWSAAIRQAATPHRPTTTGRKL